MICNDFLKLVLPLTWEDLGAIATALAVIVALLANHNSNKQLKKSLQMHEQTKNIELLDERIDFIEKIKNDNQIHSLKFRILFNDEIVDLYDRYKKAEVTLTSHNNDLKKYEDALWERYPDKGMNAPATLIKNTWQDYVLSEQALKMNKDKIGEETFNKNKKDYEELCDRYQLSLPEGDPDQTLKTYNYRAIMNDIWESEEQCRRIKEQLIAAMTTFTQKSIEPLNKNLFQMISDLICNRVKRKENVK